jgi:hypothetical protein
MLPERGERSPEAGKKLDEEKRSSPKPDMRLKSGNWGLRE